MEDDIPQAHLPLQRQTQHFPLEGVSSIFSNEAYIHFF